MIGCVAYLRNIDNTAILRAVNDITLITCAAVASGTGVGWTSSFGGYTAILRAVDHIAIHTIAGVAFSIGIFGAGIWIAALA